MRKLFIVALFVSTFACTRAYNQATGTVIFQGTVSVSSAPQYQITTLSMNPTTVGASYSQTLTAAYGVGATAWTESGALPAGLTLDPNTGTISGTVGNNAGLYPFTAIATDSASPAHVAKQNLSIAVNCTPLTLTSVPSVWPVADQGALYSFTVVATGGIAPLTYNATNLPTGEVMSSTTGAVTGTPSVAGSFNNIGVTVTDSCPTGTQTQTGTYSEQVNATLAITSPKQLQPAVTGQQYNYPLSVAGGTGPYTWAVTSGALPTPLTLNSSTGNINGVPTGVGTSTFAVTVTDSLSNTATLSGMSIAVACTPLLITTPSLPNGTQNVAYAGFQEVSQGGFGSVGWTGSGFPPGFGISPTGLVSGTTTTFGNFVTSVVATDSCPVPQVVSIAPTLTIAQQIGPLLFVTTSPLPDEIVGQPVNFQMQAKGGLTPYTYAAPTGSFPPGVTMNSSGVVSGTPTQSGSFTKNISVTDAQPVTVGPNPFSINVTCPAESISTTLLPPATQGSSYTFTMGGSGGFGTITWSQTGLPTGLTMSTAGVISGTPSVSGGFSVVVTRTDSCSPTPTAVSVTLQLQVNTNLAITTPSLPQATLNKPYSTSFAGAGGTPPYGWTITSGVLPTGITLTGPTLAGTPTQSGSFPITVKLTDSVPNNVSANFTLVVQSVTSPTNPNCNANETWSNVATIDVVNAPQTCVRTAVADTPSPGPVVNIPLGATCTTINNTIATAALGSTIQIPPMNGTVQNNTNCILKIGYVGNASNWLTIRTSAPDSSLPPEGSRITPAWVGVTSLPGRPLYNQPATPGIYCPKFTSTGNYAVQFLAGASYIRLGPCIEFTTAAGNSNASQIIQNGGRVNHIVNDRLIIHGGNSPNWQSRDDIQADIAFSQGNYEALIDSYVGDTHCGNVCGQSHGVGFGGNSTQLDGPFKVTDNFIESAGENGSSGGSGAAPPAVVQPPIDLEMWGNQFFKPAFWFQGDPTYFGTHFELDNLLEFKNMQRAWITGNIFQNSVEQGSQQGNAIIFGARNQASGCCQGAASSDGAGTITWISGGKFTSNLVSPFCGVNPGHCLFIYSGKLYQVATFVDATHITLQLCGTNGGCPSSHGGGEGTTLPPLTASASFLGFNPGINPNAVVDDIAFFGNLVTGAARAGAVATSPSDGGDFAKESKRIYIANNVFDHIDGWYYTNQSGGACCVWSTGWQIAPGTATLFPDIVDIDHNTLIQWLSGNKPGFGPGFMFGLPSGNVMTHFHVTNNVSAGGVSHTGAANAEAAIIGAVQKTGLCFDHNYFTQLTSPLGPNGLGTYATANNPPYPLASDNGDCPFTATGNSQVADFSAMQFTNLNGGVGGNYQATASSPLHNAASDGKDVGADWNALQLAIANAGSTIVPNTSVTLSTSDSLLNTGTAITGTYNASSHTNGLNTIVNSTTTPRLWLMFDDPFGITSGSGTIVQQYTGTGAMNFVMSLSGLPTGAVIAYPFVLQGCDVFNGCYLGQPPQWPKQLSAMTQLITDINYSFTGTFTGHNVDLLFDQWVCNSSNPGGFSNCLEVEILPYYNFIDDSCIAPPPIRTITQNVTINGVATTFQWDECKPGSNVLFVPHTRPGAASQELRFDQMQLLRQAITDWGAVAPCSPTACTWLVGNELGTEFGHSTTENYSLGFTKIEYDQVLP